MTVVIAGCGDLGTEVGLRLVARGERVIGLRRSAGLLPEAIEGQPVDLALEVPVLPRDTRFLVVAIAASARTPDVYRGAYVDGLRNVLDALESAGSVPERIVLVSSTAVYDVSDGSWVDEGTPAEPATATARILLEAEELLRSRHPHAVVLRLAGIYGPGRERLIAQVRGGTARLSREPQHTNRIHRDDAAAAIIHLLHADAPAPVYIGVDDDPAEQSDVVTFIAGELGLPVPPRADVDVARAADKRCRNTLLRATGFEFQYPDFRSGYRALLAGQGVRHP